jgi:hypothetical protein
MTPAYFWGYVLGLDFLRGKVGIDMSKKKPKSCLEHSWLEPNERLYVIDSSNFRCLVGLPSCGNGF